MNLVNSIRRQLLKAVPTLALAALVVLGAGAVPTQAASPTGAEIIRLTNQERQKAGLAPLAENATLDNVAENYAALMAQRQQLSHDIDGTSSGDRLTAAGYRWSSCAENIAENYADAGAVVQGWMNSPGHRANILDPNVTQIGVGVAYSSTGVPYHCQVFAQPAR